MDGAERGRGTSGKHLSLSLSASLGHSNIPQSHRLWQALTLHEEEPQCPCHQGRLALQTGGTPHPSSPVPVACPSQHGGCSEPFVPVVSVNTSLKFRMAQRGCTPSQTHTENGGWDSSAFLMHRCVRSMPGPLPVITGHHHLLGRSLWLCLDTHPCQVWGQPALANVILAAVLGCPCAHLLGLTSHRLRLPWGGAKPQDGRSGKSQGIKGLKPRVSRR